MEALAWPLVAARQSSDKGPIEPVQGKWPRHLGDLLKVEMKQRGWTQDEMAKHFNVAQSTMSRWIEGTAHPNGKRVSEIARFLQIDYGQAMKLNYKLSDAETNSATLSSKVSELERALNELADEVAEIRNGQRVSNEVLTQLLERVKTARSRTARTSSSDD